VPSIYFSHARKCVRRNGQWLPVTDLLTLKPNDQVKALVVRVRTIGDIISTGMVERRADSVDDIIAEIAAARVTERGSRADDKTSEAAWKIGRRQAYFDPCQLTHAIQFEILRFNTCGSVDDGKSTLIAACYTTRRTSWKIQL